VTSLDQPPVLSDRPGSEWRDQFLGTMEEVGAGIAELRADLLKIKAATEDADQPASAIAGVAKAEPHFGSLFDRIAERMARADSLLSDGRSRNKYGAYLMHLTTRLERARHSWPRSTPAGTNPDPKAVAATANDLLIQLEEAMYAVGQIVVPPQVTNWAEVMRVGDLMDFHARFERELPTPALRRQMLEWLAEARGSAPGIVDVEKGQIRVAAVGREARRLTWVRLGAALLGSVVLAFLAPTVARFAAETEGPEWLSNLAGLTPVSAVTIFAAILFGAAIHLVVEVLKQSRTDEEKALRSLRDFSLWAHVHETHLWLALATLLALFVLYVALEGPPTLWIAAVVGYAWDSVFDVLLGRFTVTLDEKVQDVKKAVTPAEGS
jgi:hypothetical protein